MKSSLILKELIAKRENVKLEKEKIKRYPNSGEIFSKGRNQKERK